MRKTILILFVVCLSAWLKTGEVSAQSYNRVTEKNLKLVKGKKLVLTGAVRDGDEVVYRFKARAGQRITVKITGRDANFSVYLNHGLDVEPVAQDTNSCSLTMPAEFDGHCEIGVHSTYKVANYRLEISRK
jgi:ribosomal protein L5